MSGMGCVSHSHVHTHTHRETHKDTLTHKYTQMCVHVHSHTLAHISLERQHRSAGIKNTSEHIEIRHSRSLESLPYTPSYTYSWAHSSALIRITNRDSKQHVRSNQLQFHSLNTDTTHSTTTFQQHICFFQCASHFLSCIPSSVLRAKTQL